MNTITAQTAQCSLSRLLREVTESSVPVEIVDTDYSVVVISSADWRAVQETLYLSTIPGMRESIVEGLRTPIAECVEAVW
ncbi:MAG: type II toxin-antitoxin system Phd/YefM family antitoxin [Thermoguttaceae bacterium]